MYEFTGQSRLIWHNFVNVADNLDKIRSVSLRYERAIGAENFD